jgi:hypothetical protein
VTLPVQLDLPVATGPSARSAAGTRRSAGGSGALRAQMLRWGATPVFDVYWRFAAARQDVLLRRLAGEAPPWTDDAILAGHRFTNPYRMTDRVSQHLLTRVQYDAAWDPVTLILRTLLFKVFNRVETWALLIDTVGEPTATSFDPVRYGEVLTDARGRGQRIYSPAYIVPNPPHGAAEKHINHLRMLERMLADGTVGRLVAAGGLRALFEELRQVPSLGPFLAFQYAVDINYTPVTDGGEAGFVVPGPGAVDGLKKCFATLPRGAEAEALLWVADTQQEHFARLGLRFHPVFGRRLQPIDCQNLFCETDKYARVSHPGFVGRSGRTRIKQVFDGRARVPIAPLFCPPKWIERAADPMPLFDLA